MRRDQEQNRSGKASLPVGTQGAVMPSKWYPICSVGNYGQNAAPARSVRIRVGKGDDTQPLFQASLPAGVWWAPPAGADEVEYTTWIGEGHPYCGVLRFEYGFQGMQREIYCDLRSGEYQIPPCTFLRVTAARYTPAVDMSGEFPYTVDPTPYVCEGEIADNVAVDFSPMIFTAPSSWRNTDPKTFLRIAAPPGAYAFDVYPDLSLSTLDGFDPPAGDAFYTQYPASVRDFVDQIWIPPTSPLVLQQPYVDVAGASPLKSCALIFFVR